MVRRKASVQNQRHVEERCYNLYPITNLQLVFMPSGTLGNFVNMLGSCRIQHATTVLQSMIAIESSHQVRRRTSGSRWPADTSQDSNGRISICPLLLQPSIQSKMKRSRAYCKILLCFRSAGLPNAALLTAAPCPPSRRAVGAPVYTPTRESHRKSSRFSLFLRRDL